MKDLLLQYAEYNLWANTKLVDAINELAYEQQHEKIISSFGSIYKTLFHVWRAGHLWQERFQFGKNTAEPKDNFNGSAKNIGDALLEQDKFWIEHVKESTENSLLKLITYKNLRGDEFSEPAYLILHHVFNHSTYHRGQLVTMLRQVGVEKIPGTDFIAWARTTSWK